MVFLELDGLSPTAWATWRKKGRQKESHLGLEWHERWQNDHLRLNYSFKGLRVSFFVFTLGGTDVREWMIRWRRTSRRLDWRWRNIHKHVHSHCVSVQDVNPQTARSHSQCLMAFACDCVLAAHASGDVRSIQSQCPTMHLGHAVIVLLWFQVLESILRITSYILLKKKSLLI